MNFERIKIIDLDGSTHYVRRAGLLFAYDGAAPETLLHDAARIPDFGRALKRPSAIMSRVRAIGSECETRYDAPHGRRYALAVYGGEAFSKRRTIERRIAIAAIDGIANLRQFHVDCGGDLGELDSLLA